MGEAKRRRLTGDTTPRAYQALNAIWDRLYAAEKTDEALAEVDRREGITVNGAIMARAMIKSTLATKMLPEAAREGISGPIVAKWWVWRCEQDADITAWLKLLKERGAEAASERLADEDASLPAPANEN